MNNKKVILVIILFIGISFIVYSFANPLTEEENLDGPGGNTGISEGNNGGSSTIIDNDPDLDDDKNNEEENKPNEEEQPEEPIGTEEPPAQIVQKPSTSTNQNKPSAPKYYCKVVSGKYYGKSGSVVSYSTFVSQCDSANPTLKLTTNFDQPYTVMMGTSKNLSDFYNSSFGTLGGSVTCKNGDTVVKNLNELKAGVYNIACTATGGNGKSSSVSIPIRIKPTANISETTINYDNFRTIVSDGKGNTVSTNGLNLKTVGNKIYVTGQMFTQALDHDLQSYQYITLDYVGQRQYTAEELSKSQFYVNSKRIYPAVKVNDQGKSYISIKRSFMTGDTFKVKVDWGDGNEIYEYEVHYDAEIIDVNDALDKLEQQNPTA